MLPLDVVGVRLTGTGQLAVTLEQPTDKSTSSNAHHISERVFDGKAARRANSEAQPPLKDSISRVGQCPNRTSAIRPQQLSLPLNLQTLATARPVQRCRHRVVGWYGILAAQAAATGTGTALITPRPRNSPLIAGHIEVDAQRPPHVARFDSVFDRLRGRAPVETGQHVVGQHGGTVSGAEPQGDQLVEFRQPHGLQITQRGRAPHDTPEPDQPLRPRWPRPLGRLRGTAGR